MTLAIGIPTYNRRAIIEACAYSLRAAALPPGTQILVVDDASTEYGVEYLASIYPEETAVVRRETNSGGASLAIRDILSRLIATGADTLLLLDSDLLVRNDFAQRALDLLPLTDGMLSLFNTPNHPITGCCGDLVTKSSVGSAGTLWRLDLARKVYAAVGPGPRWDWRFCAFLDQQGVGIHVVRDSLVQHLGFAFGQNSLPRRGDFGLGYCDQDTKHLYWMLEQVTLATQSSLDRLEFASRFCLYSRALLALRKLYRRFKQR